MEGWGMTHTLKSVYKWAKVDFKAISPIELPYSRNDLAKLVKELGFKKLAEIGVEKGRYSEALCKENPDAKIYGIDSWKIYEGYKENHIQHHYDRQYFFAKRRLRQFKNYKFINKLSMDAVQDFAPNSLDFVYIDANHDFKYVLEDVTEWSKIVRKGGIVSGHDYRDTKNMHPGVYKAVDLYVKDHNKKLFLLRKKQGLRLLDSSWFFVN
jgi:predicted O-methyltransferase YrrM